MTVSEENVPDIVKMQRYKYAGILPYSSDRGRPVVLLGRERREDGWDGSMKWSGFGGKPEPDDGSIERSAAREAYEETMGIIGSEEEIAESVARSLGVAFVGSGPRNVGFVPYAGGTEDNEGRNALTYFVRIEYDENLPIIFERSYAYSSRCSCPTGFLEKTEIAWFSLADLAVPSATFEMRPQFAEHAVAISEIVRFLVESESL